MAPQTLYKNKHKLACYPIWIVLSSMTLAFTLNFPKKDWWPIPKYIPWFPTSEILLTQYWFEIHFLPISRSSIGLNTGPKDLISNLSPTTSLLALSHLISLSLCFIIPKARIQTPTSALAGGSVGWSIVLYLKRWWVQSLVRAHT